MAETRTTGGATRTDRNGDDAAPVAKAAEAVAAGAREGAAVVRGAVDELSTRMPEAAAATRAAVEDAGRWMEAESDEVLTAGTSLSMGLAIGLLVGGAHRILVAIALLPAVAMGMTVLGRRRATRRAQGG